MLRKVAFLCVVATSLAIASDVRSHRDQTISEFAHPDTGLNVNELILKYGYPLERHLNIQTEDGYLLEMQRIPYGKQSGQAPNKPVVFLQHGLLCSSADWVMMGPEKGLAYLLADMGYDVWMGNARGNTWSRHHVAYDPDKNKKDFWTFSWNQIGMYDLPAMIDHILEVTGQEQLFYIGHSQGTTSFFVMGSERPEYMDKIKLMVALAPVAYMSHMTNPLLKFLAIFDDTLEFLSGLIGFYEFTPNYDFLTSLGDLACDDGALFQEVCAGVIFLIGGFDSEQLNRTMIPVILTNTPAGSSTKQLLHYAQGIQSGKFRKYDFGLVENLLKYGSVAPPNYNLDYVKAPVGLFYSNNDWLAAVKDVEQLRGELPNVVKSYFVPYAKFNHLDFLWAIDVIPLLYQDVFELLEKFK